MLKEGGAEPRYVQLGDIHPHTELIDGNVSSGHDARLMFPGLRIGRGNTFLYSAGWVKYFRVQFWEEGYDVKVGLTSGADEAEREISMRGLSLSTCL